MNEIQIKMFNQMYRQIHHKMVEEKKRKQLKARACEIYAHRILYTLE